jgi:hypothetical protein
MWAQDQGQQTTTEVWSKVKSSARPWYLLPVIPATREDQDLKPTLADSSWDPTLKKPITKKGWWSGLRWRPWVQTPSTEKKRWKALTFSVKMKLFFLSIWALNQHCPLELSVMMSKTVTTRQSAWNVTTVTKKLNLLFYLIKMHILLAMCGQLLPLAAVQI